MHSFANCESAHCSVSSSNCCLMICIRVSPEAGNVVWYSYLSKNFPQFVVIHIVKGFSLISEAEVDVFLESSCFFRDPAEVGNLISDSSAFSKSSLNIWKFSVHTLLKPSLKEFEHYLANMWNERNCVVVWTDGKASAYNAGDQGSIPGSGRSPGEGNGNPLQYSCLENSMDREAW